MTHTNPATRPNNSPVLDLELQMWSRSYGDVTVIGTWTLHNDRPCLVLVPTYKRRSHDRITPCIVTVDNAWKWDEVTGDGGEIAAISFQFAQALGLNAMNPSEPMRVFSIVNSCLSELLRMPPAPRSDVGEVVADAIAIDANTGKTIHEGEITDYV